MPAPQSGVITFSKAEGDTLKIGDVFAVIDTDAKGGEAPAPAAAAEEKPAAEPEKKEAPKEQPQEVKETGGGLRASIDDHIQSVQKAEVSKPVGAPRSGERGIKTYICRWRDRAEANAKDS